MLLFSDIKFKLNKRDLKIKEVFIICWGFR